MVSGGYDVLLLVLSVSTSDTQRYLVQVIAADVVPPEISAPVQGNEPDAGSDFLDRTKSDQATRTSTRSSEMFSTVFRRPGLTS